MTFTDLCKLLGCPLNNHRTSWCAISSSGDRAVFTVWSNQIIPRSESNKFQSYVLFPIAARNQGADPNADELQGAKEVGRIVTEIVDKPSVAAYGILCTPRMPLTVPRVRASFDQNTVFQLQIRRESDTFVADITRRVDVIDLIKR